MRKQTVEEMFDLPLVPPYAVPSNPAVPAKTPPAITRKAATLSSVEKKIIAACLVGEAGGEGTKGMEAVMAVISNRSKGDPSKFARVSLEPSQFSFFNPATVKKKVKLGSLVAQMEKHPLWTEALKIVDRAVAGDLSDQTKGSKFYHAPSVNPRKGFWRKLKPSVKIGKHQFYTEAKIRALQMRLATILVDGLLETYTERDDNYYERFSLEFAIALTSVTRWPIGVIWTVEDAPVSDQKKGEKEGVYVPLHAFCIAPDGRWADAQGLHSEQEVITRFVKKTDFPYIEKDVDVNLLIPFISTRELRYMDAEVERLFDEVFAPAMKKSKPYIPSRQRKLVSEPA